MEYLASELLLKIVNWSEVTDVQTLMFVNKTVMNVVLATLPKTSNMFDYISSMMFVAKPQSRDIVILQTLLRQHMRQHKSIMDDIYIVVVCLLTKYKQYVPGWVIKCSNKVVGTMGMRCNDTFELCRLYVAIFTILVPEYAVKVMGNYLCNNSCSVLADTVKLTAVIAHHNVDRYLDSLYEYAVSNPRAANADLLLSALRAMNICVEDGFTIHLVKPTIAI